MKKIFMISLGVSLLLSGPINGNGALEDPSNPLKEVTRVARVLRNLNSDDLFRLFSENNEINDKGYYKRNGDRISITPADFSGIKIYGNHDKDYIPVHNKQLTKKTKVFIQNEDTVELGLRLKAKGMKPLVIDMANATSPGGGASLGLGHVQEEQIIYRSNLHPFLNYVASKKRGHGDYFIPRQGAVYIPGVSIFRNQDYTFRSTPETLDFIAVAAYKHARHGMPDVNVFPELAKEDIYWEHTKNKIRAVFDAAVENGHDVLVLSALGSGVFKNPPEKIANLFKEVIKEYEGLIPQVYFAITNPTDPNYDPKADGNFQAYQNTFKF